jgi:arylformamidase
MNKSLEIERIPVFFRTLTLLFCIFLVSSCASKKISNISYLKKSEALITSFPELNVFQTQTSEKSPVVIFIHGGYWTSGNKIFMVFWDEILERKRL